MKAARIAETEIGRAVVTWLEADYWDVWQEVGVGTGGGTCDIVAKRGPIVHAIECKVVANLTVLEQAARWVSRAHFVSVAVPRPMHRHTYGRACGYFGVGVLWVDMPAHVEWQQGPMVRPGTFQRPLSEALTPERKHWPAEAGNNHGHRYTPFRETCELLRRVVAAEPGITMRAAIERMGRHHYHTDKAARAALTQWARRGSVPGVRTERGPKAFTLYPAAVESGGDR